MVYNNKQTPLLSKALSGKQLANSPAFSEEIKAIQSLAALPEEYYAVFYQTPLENFLAIYQVIDKTLIQQKLNGIIKALKMRRSYNLPLGVKPEEIREKKDLWTYAIFVAALLYKLPDITQYNILYREKNSRASYTQWNPYLGAIKEGNEYQIKTLSNDNKAWIPPTLFPVILTQPCITWLYNQPEAFNSTLELITSPDQNTPLGHLMINSHHQSSQQKHIGHDLYTLIMSAINDKLSHSDKLHNYLCLTHGGYAIAIPDIFNYYSAIKSEDSKVIEECFYSLDIHKPSTYKVTFPNIGKKEAILIDNNDSA